MNNDVLTKVIPRLSKSSVRSLCIVINADEYYAHVFIKYGNRLNIMSIDKICAILQKMVDLGNSTMAFEFLVSIPTGRMTRVILKLIENPDFEKSSIILTLQSAFMQLDKGCSKDSIIYRMVADHIQSIVTNRNTHTKYCK